MARFAPIAIVGRACLLPGAHSPEALWSNVRSGTDSVGEAPAGRWGVDVGRIRCTADDPQPDQVWTDRGGYVRDLSFDPQGFEVPASTLQGLDPVFLWALHTGRAALRDAGLERAPERTGAIFGNLGFPTRGMSAFAEAVWGASTDTVDPRNRFGAGLPALLLARALGLDSPSLALDAACASSLYAIKYACDRLHDGEADVMLAGAVNCADDLFIHVGFGALRALSKSGRSRPFHADADGLLPAEGAGFVVLKRLADARRDGDAIAGVIRGVGLSNDGRGRGFLVPSALGQAEALRMAYDVAGLTPADVDYVECHATGTQLGDATELESLRAVFGEAGQDLPLGSLKANVGHLITAAGVAGLIKVCEAMKAGELPPTPHLDRPTDALSSTGFRVPSEPEPWPGEGTRRAAVSAFGFGGNNAHLIVEAHDPSLPDDAADLPASPVVIVAAAVRAAGVSKPADVLDAIANPAVKRRAAASLSLDPLALGIPPNDLRQTLPQQLAMLQVAAEVADAVPTDAGSRVGAFVGMGVDPSVARYGARWRHGEGFIDALTAAGVIGTMPNIPTNRINRHLDLHGGSCSVFAEELSGTTALQLAARAVSRGELDAAVVGAVDLGDEPVHSAALERSTEASGKNAGDAAVALVLRREADARAQGQTILAVLDAPASEASLWGPQEEHDATPALGHCHAATGLLHVAAAAWATHRRLDGRGVPTVTPRSSTVRVPGMEGTLAEVGILPADVAAEGVRSRPLLAGYAAASNEGLIEALLADRRSRIEDLGAAAHRLVIVAASAEDFEVRRGRAEAHLRQGAPPGPGVHAREGLVSGDLAFVYTSAGSAYAGAGLDLLRDLPQLGETLAERFEALPAALSWVEGPADAEQRLWSASAVSQLHTELSRRVLGLEPQAAIGYSSGESNSLFALGAWSDVDAMRQQARDSALFTRNLAGEFQTVTDQWGPDARWQMWSVLAPRAEVEARISAEPRIEMAIVHSETDVVIGGDAAALAPVLDAIGRGRCQALDYNMCVHVPQLEPVADAYLQLHRRPVHPVPGVRFYSGGRPDAYVPNTEACAYAILSQARNCLDVPAMIEQAWADGVRVFVEHGPGGSCSRWILDILGPQRRAEAAVVSLDRKRQGAWGAVEAGAALLAAGVPVHLERLLDALSAPLRTDPLAGPLSIPLHFAAVQPPAPAENQSDLHVMKPAPTLPPVLGSNYSPAVHAPLPDTGGVSEPEPAARAVVTAPSPKPRPATVSAASPTPVPSAAPFAAPAASGHPGARMLAELSGLHTRFLQQQAAVHTAFLESRARMLDRATVGQPQSLAVPPSPSVTPAVTPAVTPVSTTPPPTAPGVREPVVPAAVAKSAPKPAVVSGLVTSKPASLGESRVSAAPPPTGPTLNRAQLEIDASGRISEIFGPLFEQQDGYARQVRMPEPPLLLADRVTGLDAEPGVLGKGTIWTETDVCHDSWYLNRGRMPGGIFIESGQADLMLISWMGADFQNKGERVYRLLGCTLTFGGDLPKPGETLKYDIHVDGHAKHDAVRLFFFHYDCRVDGDIRLSVRDGQAGFFTDEELADSDGILWTPQGAEIVAQPRLEAPDQLTTRTSFTQAQIEAFADGRPWECFGEGFEHSQTHSHTPTIQGGRMLFLEEVTEFDASGGPWGRGYMRARTPVKPDDWYFDGHFKNDPCMPGTLMFEGCFQALSLYLSALGYTLRRDSWRFQPVPGEPIEMRCRGQVTPTSKELTYEVFVEEIVAGPVPTIYADLLCTVDGRKAFHAKRVGLQLVPDWPLETWTHLLEGHVEPKPVATVTTEEGEFAFDYKSLLACAWGRPSEAFGPMYRPFDSHRSAPRLPSPPYHFMSRILELKGDIGVAKAGAEVVVEYDVPADAWYLHDNGVATMPFAVLLEAALQPCGWLASYVGSVLEYDKDLLFRNLDGTGTQLREVFADAGTLRTEVKLTALSKAGGMVITSFDVVMLQGSERVYTLKTVFGCFPEEAFEDQAGLPISDADRALVEQPNTEVIDLDARPASLYREGATLPGSKLDMLNRITGVWPQGGEAGLGAMRAEKDVRASDWYFKAHFFQDPVQPGSLGIEAMIQLLQAYMLVEGMDAGVPTPRFEPLAVGHEMTWRYRGQVTPRNELVHCTLEITEKGRDEAGPFAIATASLWVDGLRIYSAEGLGMRIVSGSPPPPRIADEGDDTVTFEPARDRWLADHCPTWNEPALPMMSLVDIIASAVPGPIASVRDVAVHGFIDVGRARTLRTERNGDEDRVQVQVLDESAEVVASGTVIRGEGAEPPPAWPRLVGASMDDPYASGSLFHGPAFQLWREGVRTSQGASTTLDVGAGAVPVGRLHPSLLDAALHAIPHDRLSMWSEATADDVVAYPARVPTLTFHGPTPIRGSVRCEVRFGGLLAPGLPAFDLQIIVADGASERVWAHGRILEACFPKGRLGGASPDVRRAFLRDEAFVPGLRLSRVDGDTTRLTQAEVDACDWMPGTVLGIYGRDKAADIAVLEHTAHAHGLHPGRLPASLPLNPPSVDLSWEGEEVVVRDAQTPARLDPVPVRPFWARQAGHDDGWVGRDLWEGLLQQFVQRVVITDPDDFAQVRTRPALFLANHQVQIESLLITHLLAGLTDRAVTTMANAKHQKRWIGWILRLLFGGAEHRDPDWILYFDQSQPQSMAGLLGGLEPGLRDGSTSFFLHPQGTRSQHAAESLTTVSSTILDLAVRLQLPIVPVRFSRGLPTEPIEGKLEFPVGYGAQDYWVGPSIQPEELASLPYAQRSRSVVAAIEALGPPPEDDVPAPADLGFAGRVEARRAGRALGEVESVFVEILRGLESPSAQSRAVLQAVLEGRPLGGEDDTPALCELVAGLRGEG
ncbi:MAG: beta-ketoacyl synthase N-terminal-like domain-containing protein [Nannocystales bacterium]